MFRGLSWSQAQNEKGDVCLFASRRRRLGATFADFMPRAYFLPLVVFLAAGFFAAAFLAGAFLVAMALVPPFFCGLI